MQKALLILGAGVDRTAGIDFPLANTLLADVMRYIDGPGRAVDKALRGMLPGLRFDFNRMVARAVDDIATREVSEQKAMVQRVQNAIADQPTEKEAIRKHGELIIKLFNKLAIIAQESHLDDETYELIREVFGDAAEDMIDSDSILDIHRLSLSDTFKSVLKRTLKLGLCSDRHEVADALGADMLNIETLLIQKFLGFYNEKVSDIKNYLYISWALWSFLVARQQEVLKKHDVSSLPFYAAVPKGVRAVTLNYTSFLQLHLGIENTVYFHGGLSDYVRMDTRDLIFIENILDCDPATFIAEQVAPNVEVGSDDPRQNRHVIPALVPPLRLKPILSHRYIELWSRCSEWVKEAEKIVVVGYSFNNADEHFNDILRTHNGKGVDIVAPDATRPAFLERMEKVFGYPANQYTQCKVQGLDCKKSHHVRLISAGADQVVLESLLLGN